MKNSRFIFNVIVFATIISIAYSCQPVEVNNKGSIDGIVIDAITSEPINGASVVLSPSNSSMSTGSDGKYQFSNLDQGDYTIQSSKNGYTPNTKTLTVLAGQSRKGDLSLTPIQPVLDVPFTSLDFGDDLVSLPLQINNIGFGILEWSISENINWLSINPTQGTSSTQSSQIIVSVNRLGLNVGEYSQTFSIISNGGNKIVNVNIAVKNPNAPSLTSNNPTNISNISAEVTSKLISIGASAIVQYGHCWSSTSNLPTINDSKTSFGTINAGENFSSNLSELNPNIAYHLRAYATNSFGTAYSPGITFTTTTSPTVPIVKTNDPWNISEHTAIVDGEVLELGVDSITEHGHCWSINKNPTINNYKTTLGSTKIKGIFTSKITNLTSNCIYYIKSYAKNNVGIVYGEEKSISTSLQDKGQCAFYFSNTYNDTKVYIEGKYVGTITQYYYTNEPSCFVEGTVTVSLNPGFYNFSASSGVKNWSGQIEIMKNICRTQELLWRW